MLPASEQRISLKAACDDPRLARDGRPVHISSVYRWYLNGARSTRGFKKKLEVEQGPRGIATSQEAIGRFLTALNDAEDQPLLHCKQPAVSVPSGPASKNLAAAECDAIGI